MATQTSKKDKAIKLRLEGKSYNEILKILDIPSKGTLNYWFKTLKLPCSAKQLLKQKIKIAKEKGLFRFNKERTKAIKFENENIRTLARMEIPKLNPKSLLLVGTALYWGEGLQSENFKVSGISFVNSNPFMIRVFMRFLRETLLVSDERIKAHIRIHPNIKAVDAILFWHKITKLPRDRFRITHQISKASGFRRPNNSLPNGTLDIRVNKRILFYKLKGYIEGLSHQTNL